MSDTLTFGATLPIDTVDPLIGLWSETSSLVFSRPFTVDAFGELQLDLVDTHLVSADGLTHTFRCREGVRWHDGTLFTADDLAFSLELISQPQHRGVVKAWLPGVSGVERSGEDVVLRLTQPAPALLHLLSRACVVQHGRHTPEELVAGALDAEPVGTGPYRVVHREPGRCELVRHESFHGGTPAIARLQLIHIADDEQRANAVADGTVELAQIKAQHVDLAATAEQVRVHRIATRVWRALSFRLTHPVLSDPRVRRALAVLIDRDEIVARALGGYGRPQHSPVPPSSWAAPTIAPATGSDAAATELRSAGWERGEDGWTKDGQRLALRLAYLEIETFRATTSRVIAEKFGGFGIPVELVPIDWDAYRAMDASGLRDTDFDGIVVGWSGGVDPYDNLASRYGTGGRYNRDGYSDPDLDHLLDQAVAADDREGAAALYRQALEVIHRDSIMAPLVNPEYLFAARDDLTGFEDFEVDSFYEFTQYLHLVHRRSESAVPARPAGTPAATIFS